MMSFAGDVAMWNWQQKLRDPLALLLLAALVLVCAAIALPPVPMTLVGADVLVIVDITGSMNTRDYQAAGKPASRLAIAKTALKDMIGRLPCPSRLALGLFSERVPFLLFEPIDVCRDYGAVSGAIDAIDWREAWEGDSHVAAGLFRSIEMARSLGIDLIFITDGQEAPPLPASGPPPFEGKRNEVRGLIVGAGGYSLSPIPKFDDRGNEIGFWGVDDVPHENRFGPPPPDAETRPGYNPRNAPFGSVAAKGSEHLSSVREAYLKQLAQETGLGYAHLEGPAGLTEAYLPVSVPRASHGLTDLRWLPGLLALSALLAVFSPLGRRLASLKSTKP